MTHPEGQPITPSFADGASPPQRPKSKRALVITLSIVGVIVVSSAIAITVAILNQARSPEAAVTRYVEFIADGKAEAANRLVDPGIANDERVLLTDEVLGESTSPIEIVDVRSNYRTDSRASVRVTLSIDGERYEDDLSVVSGPKEALVLDTWRVEDPLLSQVSVSSNDLDSVTVGSTDVALEDDGYGHHSRRLAAYPGVYEVSGASTDYVTASTESLRVVDKFSLGESVDVTLTPSEAFEKEVLKQVQARVTACLTIPTNMEDGCPYAVRNDDLAELKVITQPDGFSVITLDSFAATEATIAVRENPTSYNPEPKLEKSTIDVTGKVSLDGGKPKIEEVYMASGW